MKTTLMTLFAAIGLVSFAGSTQAQYYGKGADGITASPKHREMLEQRKTATVRTTASRMSCPQCRDAVTTLTDWTARGANKPQVRVVKHLCPTCDTRVTNTGQGKAAQTTVQHTCGETGEPACCRS